MQELLLIGVFCLLIFGPDKITSMARDAGRFVSQARSSIEDFKSEIEIDDEELDDEELDDEELDDEELDDEESESFEEDEEESEWFDQEDQERAYASVEEDGTGNHNRQGSTPGQNFNEELGDVNSEK